MLKFLNIFNPPGEMVLGEKTEKKHLTLLLWGALGVLCLYAFKQPLSNTWLKISFFILLMLLFSGLRKPLFHPLLWLVVIVYFSYHLVSGYIWAANHHFVAVYLAIAIFLFTGLSGFNVKIFSFHIRFLLLAILVLSALHKLLSPDYISGAFMQMQIDLGFFLKQMRLITPEWDLNKAANLSAYRDLIATNPNTLPVYTLKYPIAYTSLLAKLGSWISILMEVVAGLSIFFYSRKIFSHILLVATILGVFFFRLETGFLSLLALMGFWLAPNKSFSTIYLVLIGVFSLMILFGLGLR